MARNESEQARASAPQWPGLEIWSPVLSGIQSWNSCCGAGVAALGSEWMSFLNRRLSEDFALSRQMASCRDPEDMWRVYADFLQRMADDYQKEFGELARMGSGIATESLNALHQSIGATARQEPGRSSAH